MTFADPRSLYACRAPFLKIEILTGGDVYLCNPGWLPHAVGNLVRDSFADVWEGAAAKSLRASVQDGSFRNCVSSLCPHLATIDRGLPPTPGSPIGKNQGFKLPPGPLEVVCAFDPSCNLSCPSCRREPIALRPGTPQGQAAERMAGMLIENYDKIRRLKLAGNGEPFASRAYWRMLLALDRDKHPNLRVNLNTNGLLFTAERWKDLERAHGLIDVVEVSIDAASDSTYALNRRGGSFEALTERLAFIRELRKQNQFKRLVLSFVVQKNNFRELPAFVALAQAHSADSIVFSPLGNWNTFPGAAYASRAVHRSDHPDHVELLSVLGDPALQAPGVFIGALSALKGPAAASR